MKIQPICLSLFFSGVHFLTPGAGAALQRPNIILMVADDMGYGESGT